MCKLFCERIDKGELHPAHKPGKNFTIELPEIPATVKTWQDLIAWFIANPNFLTMLIAALLALIGGAAPPPEKP